MAPHKIYHDVLTRDIAADEDLDLYAAGFPCQGFSAAGLMQGLADKKGRGAPLLHILDYIRNRTPTAFVLENVAHLPQQFPKTFTWIVSVLRGIADEEGVAIYEVHWEILQSSQHGLPQHRARVYIVGMMKTLMVEPWSWPQPSARTVRLSTLLDPDMGVLGDMDNFSKTKAQNITDAITKIMAQGGDVYNNEYIVDTGGSKSHHMLDRCPCLTRARASSEAFFSLKRWRSLKHSEMMKLQGVDPERFRGWELVLSRREMGAIIGNAMGVNIMERVCRAILVSLGYPVKQDRWA